MEFKFRIIVKGGNTMKKSIWMSLLILGFVLVGIGLSNVTSFASQTELYLEVTMDLEDAYSPWIDNNAMKPIAFNEDGQTIREEIIEKALELGVTPQVYVLAVTVSTYDVSYDFEELITFTEEALMTIFETFKDQLILDIETIKSMYQEDIQAIKLTYQDDIRSIIRQLRFADEADKTALLEELEVIKLAIQSQTDDIKALLYQDLEDAGIALEGYYGLMIQNIHNLREARIQQFEQRFPRLYGKMQQHFNNR
jgi:hypothetical protein